MRYVFLDLDLWGQNFRRAQADAAYNLTPDVLSLNGRIAYDHIREDILRPAAVGKLIDQTTTSLGPTLRIGLGPLVDVQLDAPYTRNDVGGLFPDSETTGGATRQAISFRSEVALGTSYGDTKYIHASTFDFQRHEAFVRLESELSRTDIGAEIGYAQVKGSLIEQG